MTRSKQARLSAAVLAATIGGVTAAAALPFEGGGPGGPGGPGGNRLREGDRLRQEEGTRDGDRIREGDRTGEGTRQLQQPPPPPPGGGAGGPLPGLTLEQQDAFARGRGRFVRRETPQSGLGPVFNGRSCAECHALPNAGGSSPDLRFSRVTRIGRLLNGAFDPLEERGGSLLQSRSLQEIDPTHPVKGEEVPAEATLISRRITTPLYGAGLIEAIPQAQILSRVDPMDRNGDGISGVPNMVFNPLTGRREVGRFGWKGNISDLKLFSAGALLFEMGITNPILPNEILPQGQPLPPGADRVPDVEDNGQGVDAIAAYMRLLAPPRRGAPFPAAARGEQLFTAIGCASCHTPAMTTGAHPVAALRNQRVSLFSDLLLHDMGDDLSDGMVMESASGREWRTAPLWGLAARRFFLHDGRARTPEAAVMLHDGEGRGARVRFQGLTPTDRSALLAFLASL